MLPRRLHQTLQTLRTSKPRSLFPPHPDRLAPCSLNRHRICDAIKAACDAGGVRRTLPTETVLAYRFPPPLHRRCEARSALQAFPHPLPSSPPPPPPRSARSVARRVAVHAGRWHLPLFAPRHPTLGLLCGVFFFFFALCWSFHSTTPSIFTYLSLSPFSRFLLFLSFFLCAVPLSLPLSSSTPLFVRPPHAPRAAALRSALSIPRLPCLLSCPLVPLRPFTLPPFSCATPSSETSVVSRLLPLE